MIDAKQINSLALFKNGQRIGDLNRTKNGCEIIFNNNVSEKITYHIKTDKKILSYSGANLPAYFANLLPEGLRLKALTKKIKTSADDMFSLLVEAGADPVGDIHFANQSEEFFEEETKLPLDFKKFKIDLKTAYSFDSAAIAGVQDKISADRITLPVRLKNKNKNYILKLASDDYPNSIENEFVCLQMAKSCGLKVNKAKIIKDKNDQIALLVERFDREWDTKNKKLNRLHQEDACQFLNKYPADKYIISMQEIAEGLIQFSASPQIDILKLLQLKAFSYLIGNGDLHAKNISLLQDKLSPCYDILCTSIYGDPKMALMLDGKNENLKQKTFIDFGIRYSVPTKSIENMLNKLIKQFKKNHHKIFSVAAAKEKEKFLLQQFEKRIGHLGS